VLIHERMLMQEGGTVEHIFFDCGDDCALAFMEWRGVPGVALEGRRQELISAGLVVGELLDLAPYRSFFFDDPVNGLRLEYTNRLRAPSAADRDPDQRQFPASLALFENASRPGPT
jgi:hypothetical protein